MAGDLRQNRVGPGFLRYASHKALPGFARYQRAGLIAMLNLLEAQCQPFAAGANDGTDVLPLAGLHFVARVPMDGEVQAARRGPGPFLAASHGRGEKPLAPPLPLAGRVFRTRA